MKYLWLERVCFCHQQENFITALGFRVAVRHLQALELPRQTLPETEAASSFLISLKCQVKLWSSRVVNV